MYTYIFNDLKSSLVYSLYYTQHTYFSSHKKRAKLYKRKMNKQNKWLNKKYLIFVKFDDKKVNETLYNLINFF